MKQRRWKQLAAAVLALSLTACGTVPAEQPGRTVKLASEEQVTCIDVPPLDEAGAAKLTDFGLRLAWHSMANGRSALVSPMSVATALAMTANGAEGATLAELEDVLGLDKDALNGALCAWWASLPESNEAAVRSANSIWFTDHDRFTVDQEFLKTCTATYGAELFQTPMDAGTSRDINRWVKEKTEGMVPKIVDEVPESAVMYLVNALAFEGTWAEPYRKQQVQEGVFLTDSVPVQTTFLYSQETQYLENELATGVMKPYAGGEYAFAALLPKGDLTLMALLDRLDGETLQALLRAPQKAAVQTAIPKFETRDSGRLREALTDMGLSRAFTEQAELGGVGTSTAGPIFLSDVLHETFLSLGEQGTRAGAAAAVELCDGCAMPHKTREVVLDRPFVYFLVDTKTCVPLFIGTMRDPTAAAPEQPAGGAPLSACGPARESGEPPSGGAADVENGEQSFFSAEVQETGGRTFLARVTDSGNCALPADSAVQVSREVLSADGCPTLTPGQPVRVVFNGEVLETDPLQLGRVFAVYRMDSEGHCITPAGVTDFAPLPHGICLTAEAVTPTGLTLVCDRAEEGGEELWTDSLFVVERLDEATGHWSEVLHRYLHEPLCWDDMAYRVPADGTVEWELDWEALYGPLPAGIYRVVKTISDGSNAESVCCAGFSIPA